MLLVNLSLVITALTCLSLGLMIILSNPKKHENQALFMFVLSVFLWLLTNLLTNLSSNTETALTFGKSTFAAATLIPLAFLIFIKIYLGYGFRTKNFLAWFIVPIILLVLSPTSLNIVSIEANGLNVVTGPAYYLLIIQAIAYVAYVIWLMRKSYKKASTPKIVKSQIRYIFIGFIAAFVPVLILNGFVPIFSDSDALILLGPNAVVFLVIFTSLNIIQHRLLDIRLIVARSVAYSLLLLTTSLVFAGLVITIPANIIGTGKPSFERQLYYTFAAIALAFAFQPLKSFFDRWTNRLFYQDAYDAQEFLDQLNQVLVTNIDLNKMLHLCSEVIEANLKPEYCSFGLRETNYEGQRIIGSKDHHFRASDIEFARHTTPGIEHKVIVADYLEDEERELHGRMRKNDVAVLVRLTSDVKEEGIGYIVLGAKKSGNPYNSQDIRVLETIANSMVIAIENALRFEEIQQFNITLEKRVDEATHSLQRANAKLVALDQTKDDFISMASHQLRTPLTSVKGYLSMVLEGDAGKIPDKQEKLLSQAFISSQRMVYLIADLLNVSRLRTGKFVIEAKPVNLSEVIESEVGQLKETAKARGLTLSYEKPKNFPTLMLDETKIRQVIMNFTDNAIYYSKTGGHITVKLEETAQSVQFSVIDDGIGVPKHEQHHLFTKFYRAGNARKARPDGTGLGLFMAKKVVVAQGGAIVFKSSEGKGSTFGFTFAKAKLRVPTNESASGS